MSAPAARCAVLAACLAACDAEPVALVDAGRFDAREATVAPLDALDAVVEDLAATVDVRIADATLVTDAAAFDASGADAPAACLNLANEHAAAVREAQRCMRDDDCDLAVCETLCCACEVFVRRSAADAAVTLLALGEARSCATSLPCPRVPCARPTRAVCSGEGRCVTLREAPGVDGGLDASP